MKYFMRCSLLILCLFFVVACKGSVGDSSSATESAPKFTADTGALRVRLVSGTSGRPITNVTFFLSRWIPIPGMEDAGVPEFDLATSPRGTTDDNGVLVISNLTPQTYSLTLYTPTYSILVPYSDAQQDVWVEIKPNEVTDMGNIKVTIPNDALDPASKP